MCLIDGGSTVCMMGPEEFHIEAIDSTVSKRIIGFEGPDKASRYQVGTGITMVESIDCYVLLRVNHGAIYNGRSILSANQVRFSGHQVHDCPRRYEGFQQIILNDEDKTIYNPCIM